MTSSPESSPTPKLLSEIDSAFSICRQDILEGASVEDIRLPLEDLNLLLIEAVAIKQISYDEAVNKMLSVSRDAPKEFQIHYDGQSYEHYLPLIEALPTGTSILLQNSPHSPYKNLDPKLVRLSEEPFLVPSYDFDGDELSIYPVLGLNLATSENTASETGFFPVRETDGKPDIPSVVISDKAELRLNVSE